jgi:hypothetical protein
MDILEPDKLGCDFCIAFLAPFCPVFVDRAFKAAPRMMG